MNQIKLFLVFCMYSLLFQALQVGSESCRGERSERGFALFHKNYSSSFTDHFSDCLALCIDDPSCMSLNFWLDTKQCNLNTDSRETCPDSYMEASSSRYMGMARHPGKEYPVRINIQIKFSGTRNDGIVGYRPILLLSPPSY